MTAQILLAARSLGFAYPGPVPALAGVDLEVRRGELLFVIGPNGSGKSTLLRILAGLLAPQSGAVTLDGAPLASFAPRERARRIALVPQFLPHLSEVLVCDFVLGGRYARVPRWKTVSLEDRRIAETALRACNAQGLALRALDELSGGQRQRVLVARAIAQEAGILLVDEPTNALDPEHQIQVLDLVAGLAADGRSVVVVTHDLNLASQYATRLVLLDHGRTVIEGPTERVLSRAVLEPIYGRNLQYGAWTDPDGSARPFVLARRGM